MYYIAENDNLVYGDYKFGIQPNTTLNQCPKLDVLVVVGMDKNELSNKKILDFIAEKSKSAKHVIAINNGVLALYKSGIISNQKVTSDTKTLELLQKTNLKAKKADTCVIDGKFITAGPSTGAIEAAYTILNKLHGKWMTKLIEFNLEYNPILQYPTDKNTILKQPSTPEKGLKVGLFLPQGVYLPDFIGATDVFSKIPNADFFYIDLEKKGVSTNILGPSTVTNITMDKCPQLDVLIVGATIPKYISDKRVLNFILKQEKQAQAIISVCAGTFIIGAAGLLKNRNAATNYHQTKDLKKIGACYTKKEVEVDGKFFSAGPAIGSIECGLKAIEKIVSKEWAQYIEHQILEFSPNPVYGTNMKTVSKSMLVLTNFLSFFARWLFRPAIIKGYKYGRKMNVNNVSNKHIPLKINK